MGDETEWAPEKGNPQPDPIQPPRPPSPDLDEWKRIPDADLEKIQETEYPPAPDSPPCVPIDWNGPE